MRLTNHSGRTHKNGQLFNAKHNDRNFKTEKVEHIDDKKSALNQYWSCIKNVTFAECEKQVYEELYSEGLEAKNKRYIKQGHRERCKTIEDTLNSPKTAPDEVLIYFGDKDNHADPKLMAECFMKFKKWHEKNFDQIQFLDFALHLDEAGAPHIHARQTYWALDKDGFKVPAQNKAFEQMGVKAPDPDKKTTRKNNPKMTYTKMCREKLIEIARDKGLEIVDTPKDADKVGLDLTELKLQNATENLKAKNEELETLKEQATKQANELLELEQSVSDTRENLDLLKDEWDWYFQATDKMGALKRQNKRIKELEAQVSTLTEEKEQIRADLDVLEVFMRQVEDKVQEVLKTSLQDLVSGEYERQKNKDIEDQIRDYMRH